MSDGKMLRIFEREKISIRLGSEEGKISFLQTYPGVVKFGRRDSTFNVSGIFQILGGPPVLVLPWFLKDNESLLENESFNQRTDEFFDLISEIKSFHQASVDLDSSANGVDILMHSYLLRLYQQIKIVISYNFHEDRFEELNVIKGRWHPATDLRKSEMPLNFTCSYDSLGQDIPILLFAKSLVSWLKDVVKARKNLAVTDDALKLLRDVELRPMNHQLIREARVWAAGKKNYSGWIQLCDFAEALVLKKEIYSHDAGMSYQFQMDKFFESIIFKICKQIPNSDVHIQTREEILGGAIWRQNDLIVIDDEDKAARQYSIPDIIVENAENYFVLECKYKPLKVPLINEKSINADLVRYGRNDRNQLLSFLMSLRPTPTIGRKNIQFAVIFPCRETESLSVSSLIFTSAKLHIDPVVRNIIQNRTEYSDGSRLTIKFVGINVSSAIKQLLGGERKVASELLQQLTDSPKKESVLEGKTSFQKTLQRRLALSSLIVNEGRNDKTLGRVKLAKVLYLADSHLNLNLQAQYSRFAMGPLDDRMIRNEKVGIESLGPKFAYFKVQEVKREDDTNERVRYIPGANINEMLKHVQSIFPDKLENIRKLIELLLPLNTERSEIVATLYACWNDLLLTKRRDLTNIEIINEFRNNWHPSKARFDEALLNRAIDWMKDQGLVPLGMGPKTIVRVEDVAGF